MGQAAHEPVEHILRLEALDRDALSAGLAALKPPADTHRLQRRLVALIPSLISVVYKPDGSPNELSATARDVHDKFVLRLSEKSKRRRTSIQAPLASSLASATSTAVVSVESTLKPVEKKKSAPIKVTSIEVISAEEGTA